MPPPACAKRSTKKWGSGANGKIGEREEEGEKPVTKWGREKMRKQRVEKEEEEERSKRGSGLGSAAEG